MGVDFVVIDPVRVDLDTESLESYHFNQTVQHSQACPIDTLHVSSDIEC